MRILLVLVDRWFLSFIWCALFRLIHYTEEGVFKNWTRAYTVSYHGINYDCCCEKDDRCCIVYLATIRWFKMKVEWHSVIVFVNRHMDTYPTWSSWLCVQYVYQSLGLQISGNIVLINPKCKLILDPKIDNSDLAFSVCEDLDFLATFY